MLKENKWICLYCFLVVLIKLLSIIEFDVVLVSEENDISDE